MDIDRMKRLITGDRRDPREVLDDLFDNTGQHAPATAARAWAREQLGARSIDAKQRPLEAIRALREAEPRLDLRPATYLVQTLAA